MIQVKYIVNAVISLMIIISMSAIGDEKVVWEENFDRDGTLLELGWTQEKKFGEDEFKVEKGRLQALCAFKPYNGSLYSRPIPFIGKGYITFDVKSNGQGYNHLSLQVIFYDILTSFTGHSGGNWCRYYPEMKVGSKQDWKTAGGMPNKGREWVTYKIAFDTNTGTIEYYIDDMENPVLIDHRVVLKPGKDGKGTLKIGNYGLASSSILNEIDNIRLVKVSGTAKPEKPESGAMIFRGVAFDDYQLDSIIKALNVSKATNYDLETIGAALDSKNQFHLARKPHPQLAVLPKYIILADMPLGGVMPDYVQKMIVDSVKKGSTLLILGGLFTLNKGEFKNTLIEGILPVNIGSAWDIKKLEKSEKIETSLPGGPCVKFLHPLKLKNGGQVLARAGENPFIVAGKCGNGKVIVCLGMPCGKFETGETPFWKWDEWPEFIVSKIEQKIEEVNK